MLQAILIFIGLSIDGFVVMMNKGAQLRNLKLRKILCYALEFAIVATIMFMIGFAGSKILTANFFKARAEITIASLIVFFVGAMLIEKSYLNKNFEEKLDDHFDEKQLLHLACVTSLDTLFVGAAYGFLAVHAIFAASISFIITFLAVLSALLIGYNLGAKYQRIVGMIGGALMVFFGIYMIVTYVVMR